MGAILICDHWQFAINALQTDVDLIASARVFNVVINDPLTSVDINGGITVESNGSIDVTSFRVTIGYSDLSVASFISSNGWGIGA